MVARSQGRAGKPSQKREDLSSDSRASADGSRDKAGHPDTQLQERDDALDVPHDQHDSHSSGSTADDREGTAGGEDDADADMLFAGESGADSDAKSREDAGDTTANMPQGDAANVHANEVHLDKLAEQSDCDAEQIEDKDMNVAFSVAATRAEGARASRSGAQGDAGESEAAGDGTATDGAEARRGSGGDLDAATGGQRGGSGGKKAGTGHSKESGGVIYLSRVPPGMDITALRTLLSRTGTPRRMWLRPESAGQRRNRLALGGTRRRTNFTDGWVEFGTRREARRTVSLLNGRAMAGAKRRGRWGDDLWCMKLLRGFSWDDLGREVFGVGRERTLRVREEVMRGRREKAWAEEQAGAARAAARGERRGVRRFRQRGVIEDDDDRRAREAAERADGADGAGGGAVDAELAGMLFKRRRVGEA